MTDNLLQQIINWPVPTAAAGLVVGNELVNSAGDTRHVFRLASISKMITAWAVMVAVEEGSVGLDQTVGQPGCTLRHLLSHAGGYSFDGIRPINKPERNRVYSNTGIEMAADLVATATDIAFVDYLNEAVFGPLGMSDTTLQGSPAHAMWSTVYDLSLFGREALQPTLLSAATVAEMFTPQFPELDGMVPGVGSFRPCPWGLGFEIHGHKNPHWMSPSNSSDAVGHFGGAGTMMWIEPRRQMSLIALTDLPFDHWSSSALQLWPQMSAAVLDQVPR